MKLRYLAIALAMGMILFGQTADAQCADRCGNRCGSCDPCWDNCDWCGTFEFGADALYWSPMACSWAYGRLINVGAISMQSIKPDYEWGLRVFGLYTRNCFFAQLSYTWLETRNATRRQDLLFPDGFPVATILNGAVAKLAYDYQNVDLRLGQYLHKTCGCQFNLFGNVRWVEIEERRTLTGDSQVTPAPGPAQLAYKAQFSGVGLGVGSGGEYAICGTLKAFGSINFMAIIGSRDNPTNQAQMTTQARRVDYASHTCVMPATEFRFGLNYETTCRCLTTVWEIGYEVDYYWNALERVSQETGANVRNCIDLGFAGPFIGGRVLF